MIGIILVVTNEKHNLEMLFKSLKTQTYKDFIIYFVDNNSKDGSWGYFNELNNYESLRVDYIKLSDNFGFARGNNIGAAKAIADGCRYIFVLNNDTELHPECLKELVAAAESDKIAGIIGPLFLKWNKEKKRNIIQLYGAKVDFKKQKHELIAADKCFEEINLPDRLEVDYVSGGTTFCKAEVMKNIGLFEEKYFIYNDEIDLAYRAYKAGIKTIVTNKAKVWHNHDWSKKNISGYKFMYYYMSRNRVLFYKNFNFKLQLFSFIIREAITLPLKMKMFKKLGSMSITKYYYLGLIRGLKGEIGKTTMEFK